VFSDSQKQQLLSPRLRKSFAGLSSWEALRPIRQAVRGKSLGAIAPELDELSRLEFEIARNCCSWRVDKMSMAVSLEARVPFLDHKFVELAMSIPEEIKNQEWGTEIHSEKGRQRSDTGRAD